MDNNNGQLPVITGTVTIKGTVAIPHLYRKKYNINPGDSVYFFDINSSIVVKKNKDIEKLNNQTQKEGDS